MPLTPQLIRDRRATCTFPYAGDTCTITYFPSRLTSLSPEAIKAKQAEIERITADEDENAARGALAAWVLEYLAGWDVAESVAEDGTPGPTLALTQANLAALDPDFLGAILAAIIEDVRAGKPTGTTPPAS